MPYQHGMGPRFATSIISLVFAVCGPNAFAQEQATLEPPVHDSLIRVFILADQLEHSLDRGTDALRFNGLAWIGGDYNRLWINAEGEMQYGESPEDADVQALYGRLISPFWDFQLGLRYARPLSGGPSRGAGVVALQGLAPYFFESQIAAFVSHKGEISGRAEVEYDLLLTQRLIAQPRLHTDLAVQRVRELGVGRGLNDIELGLRLRYEIVREIAPYLGVSWKRLFFDAANYARDRDSDVSEVSFLLGMRLWY